MVFYFKMFVSVIAVMVQPCYEGTSDVLFRQLKFPSPYAKARTVSEDLSIKNYFPEICELRPHC